MLHTVFVIIFVQQLYHITPMIKEHKEDSDTHNFS